MEGTVLRYGVPYMGSKNSIAPWVISHLPPATTLYDLFCGGCAITHAALLSGKWRKVVANDIDGDMPRFFLHCANGGMRGENRWISHEDFHRLKDEDIYVRIAWSFGSDQRTYLYGEDLEPWKKALFRALVFRDYSLTDEFCPAFKEAVDDESFAKRYKKTLSRATTSILVPEARVMKFTPKGKDDTMVAPAWAINKFLKQPTEGDKMDELRNTKTLQRVDNLQRLDRLQNLEKLKPRLGMLSVSSMSYDEVPIPDPANSVIYCDPPYFSTEQKQYRKLGEAGFDYERFYDFCGRQEALTVISEFDMPLDRFALVAERERMTGAAGIGAVTSVERLFVPIHQRNEYYQRMGRLQLF